MALPATQIEAATTNYFDKKLTSQIAFSDPLWFKLFEKARSGGNGRNYVWKPKYARRPTQWLGRYGIKNRTPLDYFTDASLPWVLNNTPAVLDGSDIALNKGEAQLIELLAEELKSLRDDTIYNTAQKLYSGTGGLEPYGLTVAVPTTVTSGTYAGIDRSSYSWWRPNAVDASGADVSLNLLEELKLECTHGTDKPDLILTGKEGYRRLYNKATALQRLPVTGEAKRLAALGFEVLEVDGIPVVWSDFALTGSTTNKKTRYYMLNTSDIHMQFVTGFRMKRTKWHEPENQFALVCDMMNFFVVAWKTPRNHGVLYDVESDS